MGESWNGDDSYLLDNRNRTQKWDEQRDQAPHFEVVLSLRDLTNSLFSHRSAVEGAKSIFVLASSGQALILVCVIFLKDNTSQEAFSCRKNSFRSKSAVMRSKTENAQRTRYSQPVTHVSTNPARRSLTSVIGRELVYSTRYDAKRELADV